MYKESGLDKETMIESLLDHHDEIFPIIGESMFFYKGVFSDNEEISIRDYLLRRFCKDFPDVNLSQDLLDSIKKRNYYGLSLMHRYFNAKGKNYVDRYKKYINEAETKGEIFMRDYLLDFLKMFRFPLIVTTIGFKFIENMLNDGELSYNTITYNLNGNNRNSLPVGKNVYHIFGSAKDSYNWVYDEKLLLNFMHSLHEKDFMADNIINYIRNSKKRMLVLGCDMPDWLFRFLWYPIYSNHDADGEQGYWISGNGVEDSLDNFLQEVNYASNADVKYILQEMTSRKKEQLSVNEETKPKKDKFDVFISYASEDYEIVKMIYKVLSDRNIDAWFDEDGNSRIIEGQNYMNKIRESVPKCKYYMPIITESFLKKSLLPESNLSIETSVINDYFSTLDDDFKDNYSLPIIVANQKFNGNNIDTKLVEGLAMLGILKSHFYFQKKMLFFDAECQESFLNLDWNTIVKKSL